jgi:hypothetical protein
MSHKRLAVAFSLILASSPLSAQTSERGLATAAPAAGPNARYCMRVAPATGSLVETIRCWTRDEWAEQGVDVDKEWAREGVSVRDGEMRRS